MSNLLMTERGTTMFTPDPDNDAHVATRTLAAGLRVMPADESWHDKYFKGSYGRVIEIQPSEAGGNIQVNVTFLRHDGTVLVGLPCVDQMWYAARDSFSPAQSQR